MSLTAMTEVEPAAGPHGLGDARDGGDDARGGGGDACGASGEVCGRTGAAGGAAGDAPGGAHRGPGEAPGGAGAGRAWLRRLADDAGMATAEYAVATVAAAGFAGLLVLVLRSDEVRDLLAGIIRAALSL